MLYDPTEALARIDDDLELLKMLIGVYLNERDTYTHRLTKAYSAADWVELGNAAHNVKGASAAIGLEMVREIAETLEKTCRSAPNVPSDKDIQSFQFLFEKLMDRLKQCESVMNDWLNSH
ncbi:Hpt domain-containing protein [Limnobacter humi]|uniref:Hpt domain-containing protein n=1 Tax=Limnobacter humi TaxID=1778671 RepID=A0ABT1WIM9_9BURK|nr:Hpt domain-containing protein [Limnobacter humi]MCQ8897378.1 Hpt domain-containing protein [Limnobacter humi]